MQPSEAIVEFLRWWEGLPGGKPALRRPHDLRAHTLLHAPGPVDWRAWIEAAQAESRKRDIRYLQLTTSLPWEKAILLEMRRAGVVK